MTYPPTSLPESVSLSFQKLQAAATTLNAVSDELGKSVMRIDESLKKLNLGVTVWVKFDSWSDREINGTSFWSEEVGYAKVNGRWGICLRRIDGDYANPDGDEVEGWLFNDAPRAQRLESIGKIAELLEKLSEEASKMTVKVQAKLAEVQAVAEAVSPKRPLYLNSADLLPYRAAGVK